MTKTKYFLVILAAIVSGLASSLITIRFFTPYWAAKKEIGIGSYQKTEGENARKMKVIEANQFRLIDLDGNYLANFTIEEDPDVSSEEIVFGLKHKKQYQAVLEIGANSIKTRITKNGVDISSSLRKTSLGSGDLFIKDKSSIHVYADNLLRGGTAIEIHDDKGSLRAVLGSVDLNVIKTGEIRKRPESSLVLFGTDGKVVHEAP